MTTTAAAWRHVDGSMECGEPSFPQARDYCCCTTPTPECKHRWGKYNGPDDDYAGFCVKCGRMFDQPTRCKCGHSLEAVR
jgi:hypothetical protein